MKDNVLIFIDDISNIKNEEEFENIFITLPKYRQDKVLAYKNETDKYLSLLAGKLLHEGLEKIGHANLDNDVQIDDNGKPFIPGNPIFFSISHSGTKAMVVISDSEIGCDIQIMNKDCRELAERYFTKSECLEINNSENSLETFYKFWTLKESYMKATGKGLSLGLNNAVIVNGQLNKEKYISDSRLIEDIYMASYVIKE